MGDSPRPFERIERALTRRDARGERDAKAREFASSRVRAPRRPGTTRGLRAPGEDAQVVGALVSQVCTMRSAEVAPPRGGPFPLEEPGTCEKLRFWQQRWSPSASAPSAWRKTHTPWAPS